MTVSLTGVSLGGGGGGGGGGGDLEGLVLIADVAWSTPVAAIDQALDWSTYGEFMVSGHYVNSEDANTQLRWSHDNGVTYKADTYRYQWMQRTSTGTGGSTGGSQVSAAQALIGNFPAGGVRAQLESLTIPRPQLLTGTYRVGYVARSLSYYAGVLYATEYLGTRTTGDAVLPTHIRIFPSSGVLNSGRLRIMGRPL